MVCIACLMYPMLMLLAGPLLAWVSIYAERYFGIGVFKRKPRVVRKPLPEAEDSSDAKEANVGVLNEDSQDPPAEASTQATPESEDQKSVEDGVADETSTVPTAAG